MTSDDYLYLLETLFILKDVGCCDVIKYSAYHGNEKVYINLKGTAHHRLLLNFEHVINHQRVVQPLLIFVIY